jgi:hypothetical protein
MDREQHDGYTNYSTWAVCVWLDNDQRKGRVAHDIVDRAIPQGAASDDLAWGAASQAIRDWVDASLPSNLRSPASELMNAGKSDVNWLEVAATRLYDEDPRARRLKPRDLYTVTIDLDNPALQFEGEISTGAVAAALRALADKWEGSDFVQGSGPLYNSRGLEVARAERTGN